MPLPIWLCQLQPHTPPHAQASQAEMQEEGGGQVLLVPRVSCPPTPAPKSGWGNQVPGIPAQVLTQVGASAPEGYPASWPGSHLAPSPAPAPPRMKPGLHRHPQPHPTPPHPQDNPSRAGSSGWAQPERGAQARDFQAPPLGRRGVHSNLLGAYASLLPGETGPERAGDQPKVTQ